MIDNNDILSLMQMDLTSARTTQTEVMSDVYRSQELYEGNMKRDTTAKAKGLNRHTRYAQKDIMRVVESSLPDLCSPFVQEDDIVTVSAKTSEFSARAEAIELLINKQFTSSVNKLEFIETIARDIQIQGTVFVKVGWGDQPIVETVPINEIFIDPSARALSDARFVIQRRKVSVNDIMNHKGWFGEHSDDVYNSLAEVKQTEDDVDYNTGYGRDDNFNFYDRARQLIEVFEYYGVMDLDGSGELKPILGIWSENTLLRISESPYPAEFNGNPFESAIYTRKPYSIYGGSVAELLETSQELRQFISSSMIENVENNTVGQTFVEKNFLDPLNRKKLLNGHPLVETNGPANQIVKGEFIDMPQSIFMMNESLKAEQEEITGISRLNTGMDPRALNSNVSATAVGISQSNAAKRLLQITRHISEMLERVFTKWVLLNQLYLEEYTVRTREGEYVPLNASMIGGSYEVNIKTGIAGDKDKKMRDLQMMLSLVSTSNVSQETINGLIASMADLMDMRQLADEIRKPVEPDPAAETAMTMEMMAKQAEIEKTVSETEKNQSEAMKKKSEAMETFVSTERNSYGL